MRTTLTLDDDVAAEIERLRAEGDASLKDLVNQALRLGLREMTRPTQRAEPYRTPATSAGGCRLGSLDDIAGALANAEGEGFP
jgi:hypothetical protein